jgi:hypothetical protein
MQVHSFKLVVDMVDVFTFVLFFKPVLHPMCNGHNYLQVHICWLTMLIQLFLVTPTQVYSLRRLGGLNFLSQHLISYFSVALG